ncbi:SMI1/KNR4 family protein, partial [Streptomyces sp. NPDC049577]
MPTHDGAGDQVDWEQSERLWQVGFPQDYVAFMAEYGEGVIDDFLSILQPLPTPGRESMGRMRYPTPNARGR